MALFYTAAIVLIRTLSAVHLVTPTNHLVLGLVLRLLEELPMKVSH